MKTIYSLAVLMGTVFNVYSQCWNKVWSDEFNGTSLDFTKWTPQIGGGGWGNNELQYYTNRLENIEVSEGTLKIIARAENYKGSEYTSARLRTLQKGDWTYGKFEARIKLPVAKGLWPAFWMMPTESYYGTFPRSGEIDIMELIGTHPSRAYGTIHTLNALNNLPYSSSSQYNLSSGTFGDGFHVFSIEWSPDTIKWFVDNQLYSTKTSANLNGNLWPFNRDFHLLLNVAVGGGWPGSPNSSTVFPQTMEVDYVRVYQRNESIKIVGSALVEPHTEGVVYKLPQMPNTTYAWSTPVGASIVSGQNSSEMTVNWGMNSGNITCKMSTSCGTTTLVKYVDISSNINKNPSFEDNFVNWTKIALNGALADFKIVNSPTSPDGSQYACVKTNALGVNSWDLQLIQQGISLILNEPYTIKFKAKADTIGKRIRCAVVNSLNYASFANQIFNLTTDWQEYSIHFTPSVSAPVTFNFDCGFTKGEFCFDNAFLGKTANLKMVLPVELVDFQALNTTNTTQLSWQVEKEKNVLAYEIERSEDGINFDNIGSVKATSQKKYAFSAPLIYPLKTRYFRIKILYLENMFTFSEIKSVDSPLTAIKIHPNPATDVLYVQSPKAVQQVWISDSRGHITHFSKSNTNEVTISMLQSGIYQLHIMDENHEISVERFVKE